MVTRQPINMANAARHGPGEIVSSSLVGWYTSFHIYRVRKAHSKKEDRSIPFFAVSSAHSVEVKGGVPPYQGRGNYLSWPM